MMKKRIFSVVFPLVALALEILPYGAVCNFGNPDGEPWRETFSYFDLTPFGYANFAPFITAVLTCVIVIMSAVLLFTGNIKIAIVTRNLLIAAEVISLGPLVLGVSYFSVTGTLITLSLVAALVLVCVYIRKKNAEA